MILRPVVDNVSNFLRALIQLNKDKYPKKNRAMITFKKIGVQLNQKLSNKICELYFQIRQWPNAVGKAV